MRLKWKYPDREKDFYIHLASNDVERTLCGLAFEGTEFETAYDGKPLQNLVPTRSKSNCRQCHHIWAYCKTVKASEFADKDKVLDGERG